jgi:hypothetical protein
MAERDFLHLPSPAKGELVASAKQTALPLLPFERDLIAALGCSEEEYKNFQQQVLWRSRVRPAEYKHIPDIRNEPVTLTAVLINLAVGVALTAISYLLTPKPKAAAAPTQADIRQRQLSSLRGGERFTATSGFDSIASLANYGDPIPIVFGKYTGTTGGILVAPKLVWSRAFSLGSQQAIKLLMVVGEQGPGNGLLLPDLGGIFLGNSPLDAVYEHTFAFYWKRNTNGFYRMAAGNKRYGTRGDLASGDIENNDDIYLCPTRNAATDTGFCQAYTPSSTTQFGVYSAIPNATNYRVNWKIVAVVKDTTDKSLVMERIKVAGDYDLLKDGDLDANWLTILEQGQKGVGRNYGRRMGITSINGIPATQPTEVKKAAVGDVARFSIVPGELPANTYYYKDIQSTQVDDINSDVRDGQEAADDMLQIGETVMIGRTVWVVVARSLPIFDGSARQEIDLRCVEVFGAGADSASIGIVNEAMVTRGIYNDDNGTTNARNALGYNAGTNFYPLLRVAIGVVRNTRACDVTEIGIRSQVWQRANGLCNFSDLPSPDELRRAENEQIVLQSGTMNIYMRRTSAFSVFLRPAGTDEDGNEYRWASLGQTFCITGQTPQDQFNYLRLTHPEQRQFEYKLIPNSGADIARRFPDDFRLLMLDAKNGGPIGSTYDTAYGTFTVNTTGNYTLAKTVKFNRQMATAVRSTPERINATIPSAVEIESYLPDTEDNNVKATKVAFYSWLPDSASTGRAGATFYEMFGPASQAGLVRTYQRTVNLGDGRTITLLFTGVVSSTYPADHPYFPGYRAWSFQNIEVVSSSGGFNTTQIFNVQIPVTPGNPRALPYGLTVCGVRLSVQGTSANLPPQGRQSGWEYEILGDQEGYPLDTRRTVTVTGTSNTGNTLTVTATGVVTARSRDTSDVFPGQTKAWDVTYTVIPSTTTGTWSKGELTSITRTVSSNNPFRTPGTQVGITLRTLGLQTTNIAPTTTAERIFEENSGVADLSFYNSLLTKSNENAPEHEVVYVNESVANPSPPRYKKLTIAGLALKASRNFTSIDQVRCWLGNGIEVQRFLPSEAGTMGPSNKFTDLVYYLLTDKTAGAGGVISSELIRTEDFANTATFLEQNQLFFDGALDAPTNLRQFIADIAPYFLCSFVISNGKFSLIPAVPHSPTGAILNTPVQVQALFTSGNIIEGSFSVDYLQTEERKDFQSIVRYRKERKNQLPEEATLSVRWAEDGSETHPVESFDLTQFCTSRDHAFLVARYFMSLRRRITHSVRFKTTPFGISLSPGDYIRVLTEASPYQPANNGVIDADGDITSATVLADGNYEILYYTSSNEEVKTATLTVAGGKAVQSTLFNTIFTINSPTISSNTYMVEQLTLDGDGLVDVLATEFPTTSTYNSLVAQDLLSPSSFITES